jgi:hypothetical protein
LSDGEFNLIEFQPKDLIDLYLDKKLDTNEKLTRIAKSIPITFKYQLSYSKEDEIFSCFEFAKHNRILLGTQKGTILLGKICQDDVNKEFKLKIINSYNRYCNFMITNISIKPDHTEFFPEEKVEKNASNV